MHCYLVFDHALNAAVDRLGRIVSKTAGCDAARLHGVLTLPHAHRQRAIALGADEHVHLLEAIHAADVANRLAEALDRYLSSVARNLVDRDTCEHWRASHHPGLGTLSPAVARPISGHPLTSTAGRTRRRLRLHSRRASGEARETLSVERVAEKLEQAVVILPAGDTGLQVLGHPRHEHLDVPSLELRLDRSHMSAETCCWPATCVWESPPAGSGHSRRLRELPRDFHTPACLVAGEVRASRGSPWSWRPIRVVAIVGAPAHSSRRADDPRASLGGGGSRGRASACR